MQINQTDKYLSLILNKYEKDVDPKQEQTDSVHFLKFK